MNLLTTCLTLLLALQTSSCTPCKFPAIINFGDSNSDTGGLSATFGLIPSPYGETFFHIPAGRFSDGRLIIDFIAESFGLAYLSAYLDSLGTNFSHGANFATAASTIMQQSVPLNKGKLPTGSYLYNLNIGPQTNCHFCGLVPETADHIFWNCPKTIHIWFEILKLWGNGSLCINFFISGDWIVSRRSVDLDIDFAKSLVATVLWMIWKDRCCLIFQKTTPQLHSIIRRAWAHVQDTLKTFIPSAREYSFTHSTSTTLSIYTDASWLNDDCPAGLGFLIIDNHGKIWLAGADRSFKASSNLAELEAVLLALKHCQNFQWMPHRVFTDCPGVIQVANSTRSPEAAITLNPLNWNHILEIQKFRQTFNLFPELSFDLIRRENNTIADALALFGRNISQPSLFFRGMDRPRWLEEACMSWHLSF